MLTDIKTSKLLISAHPKSYEILYDVKKKESSSHTPGEDRNSPKSLYTQQFESTTEEQTVSSCSRGEPVLGKEPYSEGTPDPADSMY